MNRAHAQLHVVAQCLQGMIAAMQPMFDAVVSFVQTLADTPESWLLAALQTEGGVDDTDAQAETSTGADIVGLVVRRG